jgi:hypothetical protein
MTQARKFCLCCDAYTLFAKSEFQGGWGCLLTLLTGGLFLPLWFLIYLSDLLKPMRCQQCGAKYSGGAPKPRPEPKRTAPATRSQVPRPRSRGEGPAGARALIRSKIAGVTFKNDDGTKRQGIIRAQCRPGVALEAVREPDHPLDDDAISLWVGKGFMRSQIGYIRAGLAEELAEHMDSGRDLLVTVLNVTGGGRGESLGVNIEITLVDHATAYGQPASAELGSLFGAAVLGVVNTLRATPSALARTYRALPEWGKPIVWGVGVAAVIALAAGALFSSFTARH